MYSERLTDDANGALARSRRLVGPLEQLFGCFTLLHPQHDEDPEHRRLAVAPGYGYHYNEFLYPNVA